MKKYLFLVIVILFLIVFALLLVLFWNKLPFVNSVPKNNPEVESLVTISQSEISSFVFATQETPNDHRLHINLTPFLNFNIEEKEIKSFKIENFKGTSKIGEVLLIHPTTLSLDTLARTFLFTDADELMKSENIQSDGNSIDFVVVSEVLKFNEVNDINSITPNFGIIVKDIGTVDYEAVLRRDNVFEGSKYLEYSGVTYSELDTNIQFDVVIEFFDGNKYVKRFKGFLEGVQFDKGPVVVFNLEVVE